MEPINLNEGNDQFSSCYSIINNYACQYQGITGNFTPVKRILPIAGKYGLIFLIWLNYQIFRTDKII
jgi:hypothetical protein